MASEHVEPLQDSEKKSSIIAYLLYFFFGLTGLQHFYLGRDFYAFLLGSTFGGFGYGFVVDIFRLYSDVEDTNEEKFPMALFMARKGSQKKPSISVERLVYQFFAALLYYAIFTNAIPTFLPYYTLTTLVVGPIAIAAGVWIPGNYGRQRVSFRYPLFAAAAIHTLLSFNPTEKISPRTGAILVAMFVARWNTKFRSRREGPARRRLRMGICRRTLALSFGACLLMSGWTALILFNAEITNEYGETMKLSEAIMNFFRSPAFAEFTKTLWKIWDELLEARTDEEHHAWWEEFLKRMKVLFDVGGEERSLIVLGLGRDATDTEIKKMYRRLARKWHPDHNQNNAAEASKRFMEIQEAYELLVKVRSLRRKKYGQHEHFQQEAHTRMHTTVRTGHHSHLHTDDL